MCSFFDALNERDISGVLQVLSEDVVHQDLAHEQPANSRLVRCFLVLLLSLAQCLKPLLICVAKMIQHSTVARATSHRLANLTFLHAC